MPGLMPSGEPDPPGRVAMALVMVVGLVVSAACLVLILVQSLRR